METPNAAGKNLEKNGDSGSSKRDYLNKNQRVIQGKEGRQKYVKHQVKRPEINLIFNR